MEGLWQRGLILGIAGFLASCVAGSTSMQAPSNTDLRFLPVDSKVYFKNPINVPPHTDRVSLAYDRTVRGLRVTLEIPAAEIDRVIEPGTAFTVEQVDSARTPKSRGSCGTTLHLMSPRGLMMQFRVARVSDYGTCLSPTYGDLTSIVTIIVAPPVPID